ncbi:MAG: hypothetical protein H7178_11150 [Chitinophagaceae bacterium]|nr:hypothetical protein [Chitinophagaceae bacterium]
MEHTITIEGEEATINIRPAIIADIDQLTALNAKWQLASLNGNTEKGFVGGAFNSDFFELLIQRREVIVAYHHDNLIGYMLSVNHLDAGLLKVHKEEAEKLKAHGILMPTDNVAVGIQTAVELAYHGTGLISLIRNEFRLLLKDRYQYFFTTISKENIRSFTSATKFGWKQVGENEHYYYLTLVV